MLGLIGHRVEGNKLVIELDISETAVDLAEPTKAGKSVRVADAGTVLTDAVVRGVKLRFNAAVYGKPI